MKKIIISFFILAMMGSFTVVADAATTEQKMIRKMRKLERRLNRLENQNPDNETVLAMIAKKRAQLEAKRDRLGLSTE